VVGFLELNGKNKPFESWQTVVLKNIIYHQDNSLLQAVNCALSLATRF